MYTIRLNMKCYPVKSIWWHIFQHDRFHCLHIGKPCLWYKQGTYHMTPACGGRENNSYNYYNRLYYVYILLTKQFPFLQHFCFLNNLSVCQQQCSKQDACSWLIPENMLKCNKQTGRQLTKNRPLGVSLHMQVAQNCLEGNKILSTAIQQRQFIYENTMCTMKYM